MPRQAAPLAVSAAIAATVTTNGLGILVTFGKFISGFYLSLVILWLIIFGVGFLVLGPRAFRLAHLVREPILLAFSTASSEAANPKTLERLCSGEGASQIDPESGRILRLRTDGSSDRPHIWPRLQGRQRCRDRTGTEEPFWR